MNERDNENSLQFGNNTYILCSLQKRKTRHNWSTGVLNQKIFDATIISVNNTIYIAGGRETVQRPQGYGGPFLNKVWELDFKITNEFCNHRICFD